MKTIIAEKPSVAREIARIVGATKREEGYFEGGGYAVTWAFGHLVQLAMPDGYGVRGFVRDNLPIIPDTFTLVPRQVRTEKGYKPDSGVVSQIKSSKDCSTQANISSWRPMPDARESLSSATSTTIRVAPLLSCACGSALSPTKLSARDCGNSKTAANTTTSTSPPKRGANPTGSWASTAHRRYPSPPDTARIPWAGADTNVGYGM